MPSAASVSDIHRRYEQRLAKQKEQLTANSMPQKHDSQRSRQRMNEIQAYAEELREQEAMAFSMSEVGYSQPGGRRPAFHQPLIFFPTRTNDRYCCDHSLLSNSNSVISMA
jgi:hypothetical protein